MPCLLVYGSDDCRITGTIVKVRLAIVALVGRGPLTTLSSVSFTPQTSRNWKPDTQTLDIQWV